MLANGRETDTHYKPLSIEANTEAPDERPKIPAKYYWAAGVCSVLLIVGAALAVYFTLRSHSTTEDCPPNPNDGLKLDGLAYGTQFVAREAAYMAPNGTVALSLPQTCYPGTNAVEYKLTVATPELLDCILHFANQSLALVANALTTVRSTEVTNITNLAGNATTAMRSIWFNCTGVIGDPLAMRFTVSALNQSQGLISSGSGTATLLYKTSTAVMEALTSAGLRGAAARVFGL